MIDIDSRLPNLALMKLSSHYKQKGYSVELKKREGYYLNPEAVFASCVFNFPASVKRVNKLKNYYGDSFHCGGSGVDILKRLPKEIENAEPDYHLYPELKDRAIGFLTRGCSCSCEFCIVPLKEGKPRQVDDIDSLTGGVKDKLILLDDNILSYPESNYILEELAKKKISVNFNQTLDLKMINKRKAKLIKSIFCSNINFTRKVYHFSLNDNQNLEKIREKYNLLKFNPKDNVEFICMYGYNTTLSQDLERFRFIRSLPGAYVFVQQYRSIIGGPEPMLGNFFDDNADQHINELIQICFTQNMKSMEKYYRWLSRLYCEQFGKLHIGLVNTIFRYNKRYNRGRYVATLAGTQNILQL